MNKKCISDLALLGGPPLFQTTRSISNLVAPNVEDFLLYLRESYDVSCFQDNILVSHLEQRLRKIHGVAECITFCNGLWGMIFCVSILAHKGRKEVLMPSFAYRRSGDIAAWLELVPHFCEVDSDTLVLTAETIKSCINQDTALILAAQSMTQVVDYDSLMELAQEQDLPLIIDSVEAGYGTYKGKEIGSFGDAECFSMHASKLLNAFEAGYVTTNKANLSRSLRYLRSYYSIELSEIHAAMALANLDDLTAQVKRNRTRYRAYQRIIGKIPGLTLSKYSEREVRSFKNIVIRFEDSWTVPRDYMLDLLHAENMLARPYYYPPLHTVKTMYQTIGDNLSVTERVSKNHLLLPCGDFVSLQDIEAIGLLLEFLQVNGREVKARIDVNN